MHILVSLGYDNLSYGVNIYCIKVLWIGHVQSQQAIKDYCRKWMDMTLSPFGKGWIEASEWLSDILCSKDHENNSCQ